MLWCPLIQVHVGSHRSFNFELAAESHKTTMDWITMHAPDQPSLRNTMAYRPRYWKSVLEVEEGEHQNWREEVYIVVHAAK